MRLTYIVSVDLDEETLRQDRPPEGVGAELREELAAHIDSVHQAFAIEAWSVTAVPFGADSNRLTLDEAREVSPASPSRG